jgi:hypothetical protein
MRSPFFNQHAGAQQHVRAPSRAHGEILERSLLPQQGCAASNPWFSVSYQCQPVNLRMSPLYKTPKKWIHHNRWGSVRSPP